jgi:hypothetical protein
VKLHLGGHLNYYDARHRTRIEVHLREPLPLDALLQQFNIPTSEVMLVVLNGELAARKNPLLVDDDCLDLYSFAGGG